MADTPEVNDELVERMMQPPDIRTRQQAVEAATRLAEKFKVREQRSMPYGVLDGTATTKR